jgi:hypothetical protein
MAPAYSQDLRDRVLGATAQSLHSEWGALAVSKVVTDS